MPRGDILWQRLQNAHPNELHKLGEIMGLADVNNKEAAVLGEEPERRDRIEHCDCFVGSGLC
jgi:hypothetical protein